MHRSGFSILGIWGLPVLIVIVFAQMAAAQPERVRASPGDPIDWGTVGTCENGFMVAKTLADKLWYQADSALQANDRVAATRLFEETLKAADRANQPKVVRLTLVKLGMLYIESHDYSKAETVLIRAVHLKDQRRNLVLPFGANDSYPYELVSLYEKTSRLKDAEQYLISVVEKERPPRGGSLLYSDALDRLADFDIAHQKWLAASIVLEQRLGQCLPWGQGYFEPDFLALHKFVLSVRKANASERAVHPLLSAINPLEQSLKSDGKLSFLFTPDGSYLYALNKLYTDALTKLYTDLGSCYEDARAFSLARASYDKALQLNSSCKEAIGGRNRVAANAR